MHLLSKTTLIIGGASSGKTKFAENLVLNYSSKPLYIATAQPHDNEMKRKIRKHQQSRITFNWETIEAYYDLAEKIDNLNPKSFDIVLVDKANFSERYNFDNNFLLPLVDYIYFS